jgi:hypothetical protein
MPRLFVANLHFEQQIAGDRQTLPIDVERRAAELATCWLPLCQPGDCLWCPLPIPDSFFRQMSARGLPFIKGVCTPSDVPPDLEFVPWGWSTAVERLARTLRARCDAPPQAAVLQANSRRFAMELEHRWRTGLDRACAVTSLSDLEQALRSIGPHDRWVLKAEFSAAARQRIIGTGPTPDPTSAGWIRNRLAAGEWLAFEPWVERLSEAGLQWTVPRSGPPVLEGIAEPHHRPPVLRQRIWTRRRRRSAGSPRSTSRKLLQINGLLGPVGIDAMLYRAADGSERLRPLQDINARWTMGRLALGWQRLIPAGVWRHGTVAEFAERSRTDPRIIRTSPEIVGERPARIATWLEPQP